MHFDCNHHAASFSREEALEDEDFVLTDDPLNIPEGEYTFEYDYPLSRYARFNHTVNDKNSIIDILLIAKSDYEMIYKQEDDAVGPTGHIPGMLNRQRSEGPYGIWGHDFSDLFFERVNVDTKKMLITFDMGS